MNIQKENDRLVAFAGGLCAPGALAQSTVFTYQGELTSSGTPASGLHDFRFSLFDAPLGGAQVGPQLCTDDVPLVEGKFATSLDFGAAFATTAGRFLEIEVRQNTGLNCGNPGGFVILAPRQPITPAPRATAASVANALAAPDGAPASAVFVANSGNVGVGTLTPSVPLHIFRDADPVVVIQDSGPLATQAGYVGFWNSTGAETGWMGFGSPTNSHLTIFNGRAGGDVVLQPASGKVRMGISGELFAPAGAENLRLVRGDVRGGDGAILRGAGFTVQRDSEGVYDISFTPAFSAAPTVTVTAHAVDRTVSHAPFFLSASSARVLTRASGNFADTDFSMCVIGPR